MNVALIKGEPQKQYSEQKKHITEEKFTTEFNL